MARNQAEMKLALKQQSDAEKRAKDILKEGDKYEREYAIKGVNSVIKGERGGLTVQDMEHATDYLTVQKTDLSNGRNLLEQGYSTSNPSLMKEAKVIGEKAESNAVSFHNQLSLLQNARKEYVSLRNTKDIATVEGNIENINNANVLMTSDWSVIDGEITFKDGTKLADISLPYTTDIAKALWNGQGPKLKKFLE